MVDKQKRKRLAFHLRQLSIGLTTNDDFENNICDEITNGWLPEQYYRSKISKNDDAIIVPMLELCWGLYDDTKRHKLIGSYKLSNESLKIIARCILFLHSDKEYEWPYFDTKLSVFDMFATLLTLGIYYHLTRKEKEKALLEFAKPGDFEYWPFFRKIDYELQLQKQPFLKTK